MHWNTVADSASREPRTAEDQTTEPIGSRPEAGAGTRAGASRSRHRDTSRYRRIGPYRLFRKLGEGGMGTVYLAGRADDQFRHQVTVKLIKNGTDNEGVLRRFCNERQILAALHHPHIARLLDGGTTDDGAPYFVMEYVEGEPIDEYCKHHKLSIEARLRLFRKVCSAVQYAHQNLVVHRDIKPGNILVDAEGEPKLLDFGVAKLLNTELGGQTIALTGRDLMRFMSLPYASPEQILERPITTASDVYSLGVLLYELLTGHRPYRFEGRSLQEIERAICESDPEKPSTAGRLLATTLAGPASAATRQRPDGKEPWRRKLSGDLDNIILKAMRKEPRRRYSSADELSEDIRNHLRGLPVNARPRTLRYLAGKYIRRNRLLVAFLVLLLASAVGMTLQNFRVVSERDRANEERERAELVSEFLTGLFRVSDPGESMGRTVTARELLDLGRKMIDEKLADQPSSKIKLKQTMAEAYLGIGLYDSAYDLLEEALMLQRQQGWTAAETAELSCALGLALYRKGDYEKAVRLLRETLDIRRRAFGDKSLEVAQSLNDLALAVDYLDDHEEAEKLLREALEIRRTLLENEHPKIAESLNNLAETLISLAEFEEAEDLYREALKIRQRVLEADHPFTANSMNNLAFLLTIRGNYEEAEGLFRQVVDIWQRTYREHPRVAIGIKNLATVLHYQGDLEAAQPLYYQALQLFRERLGADHRRVAMCLDDLARLHQAKGEYAVAEQLYDEALEIGRRALGEDHSQVAIAESHLASF